MIEEKKILQRLLRHLAELRSLTHPSLHQADTDMPRHRRLTEDGHPDPTGEHVTASRWLRLYRRRLHDLEKLTDQIYADIRGHDPSEPEKWKCPDCGRWQRAQAVYCDRCGVVRNGCKATE